jgi:phosphatidyl-myo-inositol dimannoside synthase
VCSELLVFPVLDLPGDVEGFGMVAVEAAAHGLPTAAFAVGGVTDAVANKISGWLVKSGDYPGFSKVILNYLERHKSYPSIQCAEISKLKCLHYATKFSWELFGEQLRATYQNIIFSNKK